MRSLLLLRHAEALAGALSGDDHDRPLAPLGHRHAAHMAAHLARRSPCLVLCSSARRAVETLEPLRDQLPATAVVQVEREIYLAGCEQLLERLGRIPDAAAAALVVGHNPGIAELARRLAGGGEPGAVARLGSRFSPATLAALDFDAPRWRDLSWGNGRLVGLHTPDEAS